MPSTSVTETWRPVVGFEGAYAVSDAGRIKSIERRVVNRADGRTRRVRERVLKARPCTGGYLFVKLYRDLRPFPVKVAAAVAEAFLGPRPQGHDVCHNDGNRRNNAADNLRYGSRKENMADCRGHGTRVQGEAHPLAKLTTAEVLGIRADLRTHAAIAVDFGVSPSHIGYLKQRKGWKHV